MKKLIIETVSITFTAPDGKKTTWAQMVRPAENRRNRRRERKAAEKRLIGSYYARIGVPAQVEKHGWRREELRAGIKLTHAYTDESPGPTPYPMAMDEDSEAF